MISTVFLGLDHQNKDEGPPILFETMLFNDDGDVIGAGRCSTWEEAERMHAEGIEYATALFNETAGR